jgi:hypothetical protein
VGNITVPCLFIFICGFKRAAVSKADSLIFVSCFQAQVDLI